MLDALTLRQAQSLTLKRSGGARPAARWVRLTVGLALAGGLALVEPLSALPARAHGLESPAGITVTGDGVVAVRPDTATLRLGVETTAPTPAAALRDTQLQAERVLRRLRELGVAEADLQTAGLNVFAVQGPFGHDTRPPSGPGDPAPPAVYRGNIGITVRVPGLQDGARVAQLLEAAVQAGATTVQGLSFGVRDAGTLQRQAISEAIEDARPKAEAAAAAAGLQLGGVRSVEEQAHGSPFPKGGGAEAIVPGESEIAVRVLVTFDVAPAEQSYTVALQATGGTSATGTVTVKGTGASASLTVDVEGLEPGRTYLARLESYAPGAADEPAQTSASAGVLGNLTADEHGRARLTALRVRGTGAGVEVPLSLDLLGDHKLVTVVAPGEGPSRPVAQAALPPAPGR